MSSKFKVQGSKLFCSTLFFLLVFGCLQFAVAAQANEFSKACPFVAERRQFAGTPVEQARCLLRQVEIQGAVGEILRRLPAPLEKLVGQPIKIDKANLRKYLLKNKIDEATLGGSLDLPLSAAGLSTGESLQGLYFVIHDTSDPYLRDAPFPVEINDFDWSGNKLEKWRQLPVAHVFVNRAGESITVNDFSETVKKGWGTKFARDVLKADGKGLQLHIELVQPRRRDPRRQPFATNDATAPQPGFTRQQYQRLALLYIAASVRRGSWLIPAFHAAVDAGIKDAHDDPQNFKLKTWAEKIAKLLTQIR